MWLIRRLTGKKERKVKNERRHGHSGRNGNSPSPYTKYGKKPYQYNKKEWARKWPTLASTLWDAAQAGHRISDDVYRRDDHTKYLKEAA